MYISVRWASISAMFPGLLIFMVFYQPAAHKPHLTNQITKPNPASNDCGNGQGALYPAGIGAMHLMIFSGDFGHFNVWSRATPIKTTIAHR
jgi:hypothetical protein